MQQAAAQAQAIVSPQREHVTETPAAVVQSEALTANVLANNETVTAEQQAVVEQMDVHPPLEGDAAIIAQEEPLIHPAPPTGYFIQVSG